MTKRRAWRPLRVDRRLAGSRPADRQRAERAGQLAKADLVTAMVTNTPRWQGVMGGIHARLDGEAEEVAVAVSEHYLPRLAADPLPATLLGRILALADKTDTSPPVLPSP